MLGNTHPNPHSIQRDEALVSEQGLFLTVKQSFLPLLVLGFIMIANKAHSTDAPPGRAFVPPPLPGMDAKDTKGDGYVGELDDSVGFIDRFFSSAPILDKKEEVTEVEVKKPQPPVKKTRRKMRTRYAKVRVRPAFHYKSQVLPETVYKKQYGSRNSHLPKAVYRSELERAMFAAAQRGDIPVMRALITRGISLSAVDANGASVLSHAASFGQYRAVSWLLSMRVDPNVADKNGFTPLDFASYAQRSTVVHELRRYGAASGLAS